MPHAIPLIMNTDAFEVTQTRIDARADLEVAIDAMMNAQAELAIVRASLVKELRGEADPVVIAALLRVDAVVSAKFGAAMAAHRANV